MYAKLNTVIAESGIWNGPQRETHGFLLSPSAYRITETQRQEIAALGSAIYDCLLGLSHIAAIAYDTRFNYAGAWLSARRVFDAGVPKTYRALQGADAKKVPQLMKIDLLVDQGGAFKIAEIDGHNKHGLGYSTLALRFREALYPEAESFPGTVRTLAEAIRAKGRTEMKLLYADQERFYLPEFEIAKQEFAKFGVSCTLLSEMRADPALLDSGLFLDLPFLSKKTELYRTIVPAYLNGAVDFIIPPKPFFGAKGVLGLLCNNGADAELESLLRSFIKKGALERVRRYLPETLLVGRRALGSTALKDRLSRKRYVLKESISSGMKGTAFSDDPGFDAELSRACASSANWVLQEEVKNHGHRFEWYDQDGSETKSADDWFARVTVHFVNRTPGDIVVTARRDKAVHGAKDCLQIGTIIA